MSELHAAYRSGDIRVADVVDAIHTTAAHKDPEINAYREIIRPSEDEIADAQARIDAGTAGPLCGMPIAIKDNMAVSGVGMSACSRMLDGYVAPYTATAIAQLQAEGVLICGRTNMDEFAMGSSTENSAFGPTKNPHDTTRVPGGSSGGAAAAVAAQMAYASLGSDTGGSIRQPASFCGLVGLYPTYGTVSRYGLIALASSLDQIGPITHTVSDARMLHQALAQYDPADNTSIPEKKRVTPAREVKTIGIPQDFLEQDGISDAVRENFADSCKRLEDAGYTLVDISLPHAALALAAYYIIMPAEASSNLARFDGIRYGNRVPGETLADVYTKSRGEGFGTEVIRRILLGTYVLSHGYYDAYYNKAVAMRDVITKDFVSAFASVDVIATPTTPTDAFPLGDRLKDPVTMYLSDMFTVPANIAGVPALSVPAGTSPDGLPLGLQLIAPAFGEERLFAVGEQFAGK